LKLSTPWICAFLVALAHLLIVVTTLVDTQGSGEGQAFLVLFYDFPLVLLLDHIPQGGHILYSSISAYIWFFSIVGTLMHGLIGFGVGMLFSLLKSLIARGFQGPRL
jgi:hypothetical protein